jgi:NhaP-type Na+/H+ or K+/H+ antiporter
MHIHIILALILITVAIVAVVANRTRIPAAILLVLVGLVLSITPGLPAWNSHPSWCCWWCCRR